MYISTHTANYRQIKGQEGTIECKGKNWFGLCKATERALCEFELSSNVRLNSKRLVLKVSGSPRADLALTFSPAARPVANRPQAPQREVQKVNKRAPNAATVNQLALPWKVSFDDCTKCYTHQGSIETGISDSVLDNVPENHVNDKDDQCDHSGEESQKRHDDGRSSGSSSDTNETKDEGQQSEETSDGVKDHGVGKVVKSLGVDVEVTASQFDVQRVWFW